MATSKKNTVRNYHFFLPKFEAQFGNRDLDSLTTDEVWGFLTQQTDGTSQGTKKLRYSLLSSFFNFGKNILDPNLPNPCDTPVLRKLFLVEKGPCRGKPLSVRGIQKRMEYYARKAGVKASCHQLRHTMATQLLNADVDLVSIQDLLGHSRITTTQRCCTVSNRKVERDYFKAMEIVAQWTRNEEASGGYT